VTSSKPNRDALTYAKVFARQNPEDDGFTDGLVKALAKLFPRAELTAAQRTLTARCASHESRAARRQLDLIRRARLSTYLPKAWPDSPERRRTK
jgi:hypothetical protein